MTKAGQMPRGLRATLWFGLLGAPTAWTVQHVTGFGLAQAACSEAGRTWHLPFDALTLAVGAVAFAVGVAAEVAAVVIWRATRGAGEEPPGSRVHFLSVIAATVNPLFLCIIAMSTIGAVSLATCQPS